MKICKILFLLKQQRFDIQYMKKNKSRNAVMWFPKTRAIFVSLYFVLCCAFVYPAATQASCWTRSQSIIPKCRRQWAVAISFMQANNQNPQWAKKATFTHLTEPPTSQIFYPLSLSKKLLSQHICSHLALNIHIETVKSLFRVINMRGRGKKTFPKKKWLPSKRHLSSFVKGEPLCSAAQGSLTPKAASWLSIDESISKGQQV